MSYWPAASPRISRVGRAPEEGEVVEERVVASDGGGVVVEEALEPGAEVVDDQGDRGRYAARVHEPCDRDRERAAGEGVRVDAVPRATDLGRGALAWARGAVHVGRSKVEVEPDLCGGRGCDKEAAGPQDDVGGGAHGISGGGGSKTSARLVPKVARDLSFSLGSGLQRGALDLAVP